MIADLERGMMRRTFVDEIIKRVCWERGGGPVNEAVKGRLLGGHGDMAG